MDKDETDETIRSNEVQNQDQTKTVQDQTLRVLKDCAGSAPNIAIQPSAELSTVHCLCTMQPTSIPSDGLHFKIQPPILHFQPPKTPADTAEETGRMSGSPRSPSTKDTGSRLFVCEFSRKHCVWPAYSGGRSNSSLGLASLQDLVRAHTVLYEQSEPTPNVLFS